MRRTIVIMTGLTMLLSAGAAVAQTTPRPNNAPSTTTPNAITPPNGVARGVITPNRPVDTDTVIRPPNDAANTMPVIKPPAAAR